MASGMVQGKGADAWFPIPRLQVGNVVLMPQPPRGDGEKDKEKALYYDTQSPVNHHYLAVYLWARETFGAHALVHYGTHGTQEWMPGKERGLWAYDDSLLPIGDVPVVYPYIVDDVGEVPPADPQPEEDQHHQPVHDPFPDRPCELLLDGVQPLAHLDGRRPAVGPAEGLDVAERLALRLLDQPRDGLAPLERQGDGLVGGRRRRDCSGARFPCHAQGAPR